MHFDFLVLGNGAIGSLSALELKLAFPSKSVGLVGPANRLNGASVAAGGGTSETCGYCGWIAQSGSTASAYGGGVLDILDYANTNKYKTIKILDGYDNNGSGFVDGVRSGTWLSTSAMTSFTITNPASTNWVQYSHFALYGIKG